MSFSLECCLKITISRNGCSLLFPTSKYWGGGPPESLNEMDSWIEWVSVGSNQPRIFLTKLTEA